MSQRLASIPVILGVLFGSAHAQPPADLQRGSALHQVFCTLCHGDEVYTRASRRIDSFEALRRWVRWWSIEGDLGWSRLEIDQVGHYLNETYYRYPCGDQRC